MNVVMRIARWALVLPVSILAMVVAFLLSKNTNYFSIIFCGFISGCAFVSAGVGIAPSGKRFVAVILASMAILVAAAGIALVGVNLFYHFGTPYYLSVLRNISIAGGAIVVALAIYRNKNSLVHGVPVSPRTPLAPVPEGTEASDVPEIDYDALAREGAPEDD